MIKSDNIQKRCFFACDEQTKKEGWCTCIKNSYKNFQQLNGLDIRSNCDNGYKGDCCCNCKFQIKINKHPINPDFAKGSILETFGYGCEVFRFIEYGSNNNKIIFSESIHGMCEMHVRK